jgi:DNA-binding Lrp family transcriptional regulator
MIENLLRQIGFSEKETSVYMAVLEHGRISYTDLATLTGLNRTTTYSIARELLARGVIQEDFSTPVKALVAAPPEALSTTTAREEVRLVEKKTIVENAIDEIRSSPTAAGYVAPAITYIPEQRMAQYLKQRNEAWNESLMNTDKTWWGFNDINFIAKYGIEWIEWYWKNSPKGIGTKIFSNDREVERELQKNLPAQRQIRFWKENHEFTGCLWIVGEYIVTTNVRQSPHYLIEMRDKTLAHNLRTVFSALWNMTSGQPIS